MIPTSWVIMRMTPNNAWEALSLMPGTVYMLKERWLLVVLFLPLTLKSCVFSNSIFLLSSSPEAHPFTGTLTALPIQVPEVPALWITTIHTSFPAFFSFALLPLVLCLEMPRQVLLPWTTLGFPLLSPQTSGEWRLTSRSSHPHPGSFLNSQPSVSVSQDFPDPDATTDTQDLLTATSNGSILPTASSSHLYWAASPTLLRWSSLLPSCHCRLVFFSLTKHTLHLSLQEGFWKLSGMQNRDRNVGLFPILMAPLGFSPSSHLLT